MMKKLLFSFLFCCSITAAYCQRHKHQEEVIVKQPGEKGSYHLRESADSLKDQHIRQGAYEMWYEGVKIVSGTYSNNQKSGLWKYTDQDGIISFEGNYVNDKKTGCWKYYKNQKPFAIVYFKDDKMDSLWQSFYDNGKTESKVNYLGNLRYGARQVFYDNSNLAIDAVYENDQVQGTEKTFYKDGTVRSVIDYKNGNPYNVSALNDSTGKPLDAGTLKDGTGTLKRYTTEGKIYTEVEYRNGAKNGLAKLYMEDGKLYCINNFVNDRTSGKQQYYYGGNLSMEEECTNGFLSAPRIVYNSNGQVSNTINYKLADSIPEKGDITAPPFHISEIMPAMQGGDNGLMMFVAKNVVYPPAAREADISGTVYVTFMIDKTGAVNDARILRGKEPHLDTAALNVVNAMPQWIPGFENGLPVNVQFNLPIKYSLR